MRLEKRLNVHCRADHSKSFEASYAKLRMKWLVNLYMLVRQSVRPQT